jgi:HK97 family phage major capsid protein
MSKETKAALAALVAERAALVTELETVVNAAATETRDFTPEENFSRGELTVKIQGREDAIAVAEAARKTERKEKKAAQARMQYGTGYTLKGDGQMTKLSEHRVYESGNGRSFLQDAAIAGFGAGLGARYFGAVERLQRHGAENHIVATEIDAKITRSGPEQYFLDQMIEAKNPREDNHGHVYSYRDFAGSVQERALSISQGAGGEFVPPLFQTLEWIAFMRAGRPLADCQNKQPLPDGTMNINIPKVVGGTAVGPQSGGENTPVLMQNLQTAYISLPVVLKAGGQLISLQLLERSPIAFDQMAFKDLGKAYAQAVDVAVAAGNGTNQFEVIGAGSADVVGILNTTGVQTVTWTQATPTLKGLYGQLGQAKADVFNTLFLPSTHCFMSPTYWEFLASQFDSAGRPLVVPSYLGPFNAAATATDAGLNMGEGATGTRVFGLDTYADANLPQQLGVGSNQSVILGGRFEENYLFESPVVTRVLPQTYGNQMSVLLQIYGYIAFTAARYANANFVISGTGLVTPTFAS